MKPFLYSTCFVLALLSHSLEAATFYVSLSGNDTYSGNNKSQPWASITKVNSTIFSPGDSVLFEGGKTFVGSIVFGEKVGGTASEPIVFSSYGEGKATISSGDNVGFSVQNSAGFKIQNIVIKGSGRTSNESNGIEFFTDLPSSSRLEYISINGVDISGYSDKGIYIGSWNGAQGYYGVSITNSSIHDNGEAGIVTYAEAKLGHQNMYVGHNKIFNITGIKGRDIHTGNGIVIGDVDGVLIEYCEVYNNGEFSDARDTGPAGVWAYKCNDVLIQYNEAHHNKTGGTKDGGGFDIDGGVTNAVMQYNYSHDNDGAGFLVSQYRGAPPLKNVTIRYNISENDGRKNSYAGILFWSSGSSGGIQDVEVYNNTVYLTPSSGWPSAIRLFGELYRQVRIRNNVFQTTPGTVKTVTNTADNADILFQGNSYWNAGEDLNIEWEKNKRYTSLEAWRAATGPAAKRQETLNGSPVGYFVDPQLNDPGKGVTISDPTKLFTLSGYELQETSPLIDKGLDLSALFGIKTGTQDFFGNSLKNEENISIGAYQVKSTVPLPVTLSIFEVSTQGTAAVLYWETASEQNNKGFDVEVSVDGENFRTLSFVASKSSNSQQTLQYTFHDTEDNKTGTRYYRLRQIDTDGASTYSEVKMVTFEQEHFTATAYPNPFSSSFTLEVKAETEEMLQLFMSDAVGRHVLLREVKLQQGRNRLTLEIGRDRPAGLYIISARHGDKNLKLKVLKQ
ncbi:right-handed parallel beta-helix repeat-containing protein [Pontibacter pamirensis]|uniref:right-handed parallel beta-helix repeat-containing protein n=1 Tax=Pontibacter pamirensis TaxID=2562824 RepID=UPI001389C354|nr:right-handed parallel beta-helix repeat-containing protein [Pontibacter pamirensis]